MTQEVTYWRSIYTFPNWKEDLRQNRSLLYLGTYTKAPTTADVNLESIRKAVIKANFQAKTHIVQFGETLCVPKSASKRYEWKVIVGTITTLFSKSILETLTLFFLVIILPHITLKAGFNPSYFFGLFIFTTPYTIGFYQLIKDIQKPYVDGYVLFQRVSYIPNSMTGFDLNQLANNKRENGWDDPITLETIPPDQITTSQVLRIGKYASSMIPVLRRMVTTNYTNCPEGEIPHPYEQRALSSDEKTKFLREVSAFFSIPSEALEKCWSVQVKLDDLTPYVDQIKHWFFFPNLLKHRATVALEEQLRLIKKKQAFLKLLTDSVAQKYFSKQFRCSNVSIPTFTPQQIQDARTQEIENVIEEVRFLTTLRVLQETGALNPLLASPSDEAVMTADDPPTPTSVQSGNAGPP